MKITKEQFVACIEAIRRQDEETNNRLALMKQAGFEWDYDYFCTENALIQLLQDLTNDKFEEVLGMSNIEYFCYEHNFGKTGPITSPGQLYKLLQSK